MTFWSTDPVLHAYARKEKRLDGGLSSSFSKLNLFLKQKRDWTWRVVPALFLQNCWSFCQSHRFFLFLERVIHPFLSLARASSLSFCLAAHNHAFTHTHTHSLTHINIQKCTHVHVCMWVYIRACVSKCVCLCVEAPIHIHAYSAELGRQLLCGGYAGHMTATRG